MSYYENTLLPWAIDKACSMHPIMELREKVVPLAYGDVLEVGMGSGINLALYDNNKVNKVYGLEPSEGMRKKALPNIDKAGVEVEWLGLPGEKIPLGDDSIDTVLLTYTLCTIPGWQEALAQIFRVLKPGGLLLFCEHGRAPDKKVQKWQDKLTPLWKKCAGGCHLNRPVLQMIEDAGFVVESSETFYMEKAPRFVAYMYLGRALKPSC